MSEKIEVEVELDEQLVREIEEVAEELGMTFDEFMEEAAREKLELL